MDPGQTAWFMKQYEGAAQRPFGYLFVDLKPTTHDSCRLRTNVLPGEDKVRRRQGFSRTITISETAKADGSPSYSGDAALAE